MGCCVWCFINVGCYFHNYPVTVHGLGLGGGPVMKEWEVASYILGEELGKGMSEPASQTGASFGQWHSGKSS